MKTPTLGPWLDKFARLRMREVSDLTNLNYDATAEYLRQFFGEDKALRRITSADADDFRAYLRSNDLAPSTVCSHMARCVAIFDRAKLRQLIRENPFAGLATAPPRRVKDWRRLTADEVVAIVQAAPTDDWRRLIGLCAYAGLRRGEALRLLGGDIDRARHRLNVVPDTKYETTKQRAREVLLVPELVAILDPGADPDMPVVGECPNLHRAMVGYTDRGVFRPGIIQRAGLEVFDAPFHTLRRWRATSWREQGFPEFAVNMWLGHSSAVASEFYVTVPESLYQGASK